MAPVNVFVYPPLLSDLAAHTNYPIWFPYSMTPILISRFMLDLREIGQDVPDTIDMSCLSGPAFAVRHGAGLRGNLNCSSSTLGVAAQPGYADEDEDRGEGEGEGEEEEDACEMHRLDGVDEEALQSYRRREASDRTAVESTQASDIEEVRFSCCRTDRSRY